MDPKQEVSGRPTFLATLLDYNGVLVDDEALHLAAFREVLAPLGVEVSEDAYWQRYLGYDDAGAFRAILGDAGRKVSEDSVRELVDAKRPVYAARARAELVPFAGARELVVHRAAHGPVGIVSGALESEIELGLCTLDVRDRVSVIVAAEDTTESKPSPEGYRLGIERLAALLEDETAARRALVVEDSIAGVEAAKAAGLTCIAVAHSYPSELLSKAGADQVVERLALLDETLIAELYAKAHG